MVQFTIGKVLFSNRYQKIILSLYIPCHYEHHPGFCLLLPYTARHIYGYLTADSGPVCISECNRRLQVSERICWVGCVPVACHLLCNFMGRELHGMGAKVVSFHVLWWQVFGCTTETPRIFWGFLNKLKARVQGKVHLLNNVHYSVFVHICYCHVKLAYGPVHHGYIKRHI